MSSRSAITLRIVAGEKCGKWRFESTREPTGSAESTYSRMRAIRTSRCRASIYLMLQQVDEQRVRDDESRLRQPRAGAVQPQVTGLSPRLDPARQGGLARRALGQTLARREPLGGLHGQRGGLDGGTPARERLDVTVAHVADEAAAAGAGGEVLAGAPVAEVVPRAAAGARVVGDLVVLEAARGGGADEGPVLRDDRVLVRQVLDAIGAPRAAAVERERVRGDVVRSPVEHALDVGGPRVDREAGQPVHEVDAHVVAAGLTGRVEGRARATRVVQAAERREHGIVQRLHAEAHAGDAGRAVAREALARHALG